MSPVVFAFPGNEVLANRLAEDLTGERGVLFLHRFPDGEIYVRLDSEVSGRACIFVCSLNRPDAKLLPLLFAVDAARRQGASRCGIVAPYLAYLRQDRAFRPGEAITSATFGRIVSGIADWIVTVDPHLHRYGSLDEVYGIPSAVAHAAPVISEWLIKNVEQPLLIGPDAESEQWVAEVADGADAPYVVLEKIRHGDREVEVSVPHLDRHGGRTPVLVDDIVSTARTMVAALSRLRATSSPPPVCVAVHALFGGDAYDKLVEAGAQRIATCNTVPHASNAIDIHPVVVRAVRRMLPAPPSPLPQPSENGAFP